MTKWILFLVLLFSRSSFAYNFASDVQQGMFWSSFPLTMQVVVPTDDGGLLMKLVKESEQEWEDSLGLNIWDIRAAASGDENTIYWENDFGNATGYNPNQTLAVTFRYQQMGIFSKVQIVLNGSMSTLRQNWNSLLKKTILHEMGHTFGLDHSTEPAIMQAYIGAFNGLQADDIAGGNAVIDVQVERQATGAYLALDEQGNQIVACGSITTQTDINNGGSNLASLSFLISLLLGFIPVTFFRRRGQYLTSTTAK